MTTSLLVVGVLIGIVSRQLRTPALLAGRIGMENCELIAGSAAGVAVVLQSIQGEESNRTKFEGGVCRILYYLIFLKRLFKFTKNSEQGDGTILQSFH